MTPEARMAIFRRLQKANPRPKTELVYRSTFQLLVTVILSAQATDVSVNKATRPLFKIANTPEGLLELGETELKKYIRTIGLYNTKAKNILRTCRILLDEYGGEVPVRSQGAGSPARRGPQDRQHRAQHRFQGTDHRRRYACVPRGQSHRTRAGQDAARRRGRSWSPARRSASGTTPITG
jgi:hypothetical protein